MKEAQKPAMPCRVIRELKEEITRLEKRILAIEGESASSRLKQAHVGNCPAHFWSETECIFKRGRCVRED